jgi:hypothetical protein
MRHYVGLIHKDTLLWVDPGEEEQSLSRPVGP